MKLIIDKRDKVGLSLIEQAQQSSPRDGFRLDFFDDQTENKYMHFLKRQLLAILVNNNNQLLSFAGFGNDDRFTPHSSYFTDTLSEKSIFFMYFFTPVHLKGQGYGKILYNGVLGHTRSQNKGYEYMIYSTMDLTNAEMYIKRGAEKMESEILENETQYYFRHALS